MGIVLRSWRKLTLVGIAAATAFAVSACTGPHVFTAVDYGFFTGVQPRIIVSGQYLMMYDVVDSSCTRVGVYDVNGAYKTIYDKSPTKYGAIAMGYSTPAVGGGYQFNKPLVTDRADCTVTLIAYPAGGQGSAQFNFADY